MPIKWQPYNKSRRPMNFPHLPSIPQMPQFPQMPDDPDFNIFPQPQEEPAVDIYQDKANLYIEVSLNGIKPENVEINIEDDILFISGNIQAKKQIKEQDYFRKEIRTGAFRRAVKLPVPVKGDKAKAEAQGGILKITAPKIAKANSKKTKVPIEIK